MMMEIYLSIEKAKHYNIDIDKCYDKIDKYFIENGVKKISTGIYKGNDKDFDTIMGAQWNLPKTSWFLIIIDQWYCRYEGDTIEYREDALESYYKIKVRNEKSIGVISFKDKLNMCISSKLYETETERDIFKILSSFGIDITVYSNRRDLYGTR